MNFPLILGIPHRNLLWILTCSLATTSGLLPNAKYLFFQVGNFNLHMRLASFRRTELQSWKIRYTPSVRWLAPRPVHMGLTPFCRLDIPTRWLALIEKTKRRCSMNKGKTVQQKITFHVIDIILLVLPLSIFQFVRPLIWDYSSVLPLNWNFPFFFHLSILSWE